MSEEFQDAIDNNKNEIVEMSENLIIIDIDEIKRKEKEREIKKYDELLKDKQIELLGIIIEIQDELRRNIREMQIEIYKDIMKENNRNDNRIMEILMALSLI
jgi:hypothetical protein